MESEKFLLKKFGLNVLTLGLTKNQNRESNGPVSASVLMASGTLIPEAIVVYFADHILTHLAAARAERLDTTPKRRR